MNKSLLSTCASVVLTCYFAAVASIAFAQATDEPVAPPNLVMIIADDMNWNDCGAYGHPSIRTPNIDQLAAEGLQFQHAYLTTNSCSPSRSSILTGKYPHNTGAEQLHWPLPEDSQTFSQKLQQLGYYTAVAGKWHLGDAVRDHFDRIYEASTDGFVLPSGEKGQPAKMVAAQPSGCEDWVRALEERPKEKPFFLWLAAIDPHREYSKGALDPPHRLEDVVVPPHLPDTPDVREDLRLYYDEVGRLDMYVGKVMAALKQQGVAENTLVLFISDNGRPFPRDKTTLYDGGIRTPWIVRWPDKVVAGKTTNALVSSVDIASTFMELAGSESEANLTEGKSFVGVLADPTNSHRQYAFGEDHWHDYEDHARCVVVIADFFGDSTGLIKELFTARSRLHSPITNANAHVPAFCLNLRPFRPWRFTPGSEATKCHPHFRRRPRSGNAGMLRPEDRDHASHRPISSGGHEVHELLRRRLLCSGPLDAADRNARWPYRWLGE